ncbi:DsbA family oxidoreductase [Fimbriiglobus ruber]|nr:DsbA family oxidoreductase [Fimbriiglobus ruber]
MIIDVYSDIICPWCFIGKRRLEKAIAMLGAGDVAVRWHPFQLNPDMPREGVERRAYRIKKFGSWENSQAKDAQVAQAGRGEGLTFDYEKQTRTPNTLDGHRIIWLAGERGVQGAVVEAMFKAYFTDGRDLSDRATLVAVAVAVEGGLDAGEVADLLAGDAGLAEVREQEQMGRHLGVTGVPFVVINDSVAASGAQSPEMFLKAFEQAGEEVATGDACEVDPATGKRGC